MIDEITDKYRELLSEKVYARTDKVTGWSVIGAPFLDNYNDTIEVYIKREEDIYKITDGGHTDNQLKESGLTVGALKWHIQDEAKKHGFNINRTGEVVTRVNDKGNIADEVHRLAQFIIKTI